ncbi:RNase P/RNase MRP complex subunit [Chamberlinius hualienensis]
MDVSYVAYKPDTDGHPLPIADDQKYKVDTKESENGKKMEIQSLAPFTFREAMSPVVAAFLFFGVDVRPIEDSKRGRFVSFILPVLHLLFYVATYVLFYINVSGDDTGVRSFSANMAQGLCITAFFITHFFFFCRRKRISILLDEITKALIPTCSDEEPPPETIFTSTRWLALALVPLPFILLMIAFCALKLVELGKETYNTVNPAISNATTAETSELANAYFTVFLFFFGVIFCYFVYAVGLYCIIIRVLTLIIDRLKCPGVMTGSVSAALADVATFLRLHEVACKLVVQTDSSFKEVACVWCTVEMTCAVLFGRSANVNFKDTPDFDFVLAFIVIILLFVYKVLATATVNDSVISSLKEISYVDENTLQDLSPRSAALATKIKLYIQHVMVSSPTITGWGLFTIDKAVVLSAAGSILTYILVLYDKMTLYADLPEDVINNVIKDQCDEGNGPGNYLNQFLGSRCQKNNLSLDFFKTVLMLDSRQVKLRPVTGKKRKQLSSKAKRKLKIYTIDKNVGSYEEFLPLHSLWVDYFRQAVKRNNLTSRDQSVDQSELGAKLLKSDYHGCIMTVTRSKCSSYVGVTGILLQENRNSLKLMTKSGLKVIPKMNSVFTFELDGTVFTIYGNHFKVKSSERAVRRFKSKATIDL